jgi:hypothetical protein
MQFIHQTFQNCKEKLRKITKEVRTNIIYESLKTLSIIEKHPEKNRLFSNRIKKYETRESNY